MSATRQAKQPAKGSGRKKPANQNGRKKPAEAEALEEQRVCAGVGADFVIEKLRVVAERSLAAVPAVNSKGEETGVWQFNAAAATKALELMGKHLGMFGDKGGGAVPAVPGVELVLHTSRAGSGADDADGEDGDGEAEE